MNRILFSIIFLNTCLSLGCERPIENRIKKYTFAIDNSNPAYFGYGTFDDGPSIGPFSIVSDSGFVFITDPFHGNVKKIDIETGEIQASDKFSKKDPSWPNDIIVFRNLLYITSDLDSIYVLTKTLLRKQGIKVSNNTKYFVGISENKLEVHITVGDSVAELDANNVVRYYKKKAPRFRDTVHGKKYAILRIGDQQYIETDYYKTEIGASFHFIEDYDANNLDFDSRRIVYFTVDEKALTLFIVSPGR